MNRINYGTDKLMPDTRAMRADEIAIEFNVSKRTILNWYAAGIIPASVAVNRVLRFSLDDVREALAKSAK